MLVLRPPARAGLGAALRGARERRVAARHARPAQPLPPPLARRARAARAGRGGRGDRAARRDRAPLRGGQPAPAVDLALLLAARLAVARAGHAHAAPRRWRRAACCPSARRGGRTARCDRSTRRRSREPLPYELLAPSPGGFRRIERDLGTGAAQLIFDWDCGGRYALRERHRVRGHVRGDLLDRRGRSPVGHRARGEHRLARPGRLAGLDCRDRDDDVHGD